MSEGLDKYGKMTENDEKMMRVGDSGSADEVQRFAHTSVGADGKMVIDGICDPNGNMIPGKEPETRGSAYVAHVDASEKGMVIDDILNADGKSVFGQKPTVNNGAPESSIEKIAQYDLEEMGIALDGMFAGNEFAPDAESKIVDVRSSLDSLAEKASGDAKGYIEEARSFLQSVEDALKSGDASAKSDAHENVRELKKYVSEIRQAMQS